jgi:alkanesulfonate monooxygenase SsuD/methylene tetrahydromethanopterin reductase-like flavin-dependent oxidoreductase (luciferase family)
VEFAVNLTGHVPERFVRADPANAERDRLFDEIAVVQAADRSGIKYAWATEHHFLQEYAHISSPEVLLSHLAATTERIHLGTGIIHAPPMVNHPVRTAERAAMLDILSGGRFELGLGRGSSSVEHGGFGIDDPATTRDMFDEVATQIPRMWRDEPYRYDGKWFSVPERQILPKPWAKPHPPLWVAAANPPTFEKAARMGLGVLCFSPGAPEVIAPLIEIYKRTIEQAEPVGAYVNDVVLCVSSVFCMEDGDAARRFMTTIDEAYFQSLFLRWLDTFPRPEGVPVWPDTLPEPTVADFEQRLAARMAAVGDPDEVAEVARAFEDVGCDVLCFTGLPAAIPVEAAVASIELVGREVVPRFDTDPVHRTTRAREAAGVASS